MYTIGSMSGSRERAEGEKNCIFCKIIEGSAPSSKISETERVITFMSLEGYPLVVTKKHIVNLLDSDLDDDTAAELGKMERDMAVAVEKAFEVDSVSVYKGSGPNAGQEVMHLHSHIIPRKENDRIFSTRLGNVQPREELERISQRLKSELLGLSPQL